MSNEKLNELRDDELEDVSGGVVSFNSVATINSAATINAAQTINGKYAQENSVLMQSAGTVGIDSLKNVNDFSLDTPAKDAIGLGILNGINKK